MTWPATFIQQMQQQLGESQKAFFEALQTPPPVSIHVNPQKPLPFQIDLEPVLWNPNGYYLPSRPVFTLDPLFHAGTYYVMEASSMFLAEAVRQCVDLDEDLKVLDLAAAPGGKTIVLASILSSESLLLSNEVINSRYQTLKYNVTKWGYPNIWTSNNDAQGLKKLGSFFDLVVVDAPCSGEGLFRREPEAATEWSEEQVQYCSARQKKILADTVELIRPGGCLIYSTCTFNTFENDQNARWLCEQMDLQPIRWPLSENGGIQATEYGYQFYPHLVKGEGFYLACFRKKGEPILPKRKKKNHKKGPLQKVSQKEISAFKHWIRADKNITAFLHPKTGELHLIPAQLEATAQWVAGHIKKVHIGTTLGSLKREQLVPSPAWALSSWKAPDLPAVDLDETAALRFLRKDLMSNDSIPRGWQLITYKGQGIGWVKGLGNRVNNYHPNAWRIRMDIPEQHSTFWESLRS
jgi:16S rRNA C967 or C1407 C5-methylase (RsmB/RsmF family)/NOL1/NOP2/fmu family ribosome biogenesis protein